MLITLCSANFRWWHLETCTINHLYWNTPLDYHIIKKTFNTMIPYRSTSPSSSFDTTIGKKHTYIDKKTLHKTKGNTIRLKGKDHTNLFNMVQALIPISTQFILLMWFRISSIHLPTRICLMWFRLSSLYKQPHNKFLAQTYKPSLYMTPSFT